MRHLHTPKCQSKVIMSELIKINRKDTLLISIYTLRNLLKNTAKIGLVSCVLLWANACKSAKKTEEESLSKSESHYEKSNEEKDAAFLCRAAEIHLEEIRLADLVKTKSNNTDVKQLAFMLMNEHSSTLSSLIKLAEGHKIELPSKASDDASNTFNQLSSMSSADFDVAFCDEMINVHNEAITLFTRAKDETSDAEIKAWSTGTLFRLEKHLKAAQQTRQKISKVL